MPDRRAVLNRMALGGIFLAAVDAAQPAAAQETAGDRDALARAVQGFRDELARQATFWEIAPVRDQLRSFLRSAGKFPDYIEVGSDVWQQVYDWHVRYGQPITVSRTADGRYTILLMQTMVVMRPDVTAGYIGLPYDNR